MTNKQIDVYPMRGREVSLNPTGEIFGPNGEVREFIEKNWEPKKAQGWKSSWIPLGKKIGYDNGAVIIDSDVMTYAQTDGLLNAIKSGEKFAQGMMKSAETMAKSITESAEATSKSIIKSAEKTSNAIVDNNTKNAEALKEGF